MKCKQRKNVKLYIFKNDSLKFVMYNSTKCALSRN